MPAYRFGRFVLDTSRQELLRDGALRRVEPQVFDLILYLIDNRDRVVGRDELIRAVWGRGVISDAAVSSRVSAARRALDDDGRKQHAIKTVPRRGFRFVLDVAAVPALDRSSEKSLDVHLEPHLDPGHLENWASLRPSLFIAAFRGNAGGRSVATSLTRDVTIGFARLRSLFVFAQATAFALAEKGKTPLDSGRLLGADYCVFGHLVQDGSGQRIILELVATESGNILWAGDEAIPAGDIHEAPTLIADRIVAALAGEIEIAECRRARLKPAGSLDAWEAHHRGLWHLHRFTADENDKAICYFNRATALDPALSRAWAALSYARWLNAFSFRPAYRDSESDRAYEAAGRGLHADPKDPMALWSMSRALWLKKDEDGSLRTIDRAIDLSPSFAHAHHAKSFVDCQTGDAKRALTESRYAQRLSPFDPLRYAMFGVEAFSFVRLRRYKEAANAARRLISKPNAHIQARGLAALVLALSGADVEARREIGVVRRIKRDYTVRDFLTAYHVDTDQARRFRNAAARIGIG